MEIQHGMHVERPDRLTAWQQPDAQHEYQQSEHQAVPHVRPAQSG